MTRSTRATTTAPVWARRLRRFLLRWRFPLGGLLHLVAAVVTVGWR